MIEADPALLDALYGGATDTAEFLRALTMLSGLFSCRSAALVSLETHAPANLVLTTGAFDGDVSRSYVEFAPVDPAPAAFSALARGTASTTDRLLPPEKLGGEFVNEFFRPNGFAETLGGHLHSDHAYFTLIGLHRGNDRPPFEDDELAAVERLMPHITRALRLRREFLGLQAKANGLQAALDDHSAGVLLLNSSGASLFANRALRAIAQRGDGFSLDRTGRPVLANSDARRRIDALIASVMRGGPGGVMAAPRRPDLLPYAVLVSPSPASLLEMSGRRRTHSGVLLIVHDSELRLRTDPEILQHAFGLSPASARLVAGLAAVDDLKSYAEREGVTIHTARFHLRTALARTGTRTQAQLVRLAVRLLAEIRIVGR